MPCDAALSRVLTCCAPCFAAVVVVFGFFVIALLWWTLGGARHFFKGPLRVDANVFKQIAREAAAAEASR